MTNDLMTAVSHTRDSPDSPHCALALKHRTPDPVCAVTPCALDVNRNFDLHVFSRAGPVAAAANLVVAGGT
jgi:hypothetical protein